MQSSNIVDFGYLIVESREYGEKPRERLLAADGDAAALLDIMDEFPDWVEPPNRLATLLPPEAIGSKLASLSRVGAARLQSHVPQQPHGRSHVQSRGMGYGYDQSQQYQSAYYAQAQYPETAYAALSAASASSSARTSRRAATSRTGSRPSRRSTGCCSSRKDRW